MKADNYITLILCTVITSGKGVHLPAMQGGFVVVVVFVVLFVCLFACFGVVVLSCIVIAHCSQKCRF